MIKLNKIGRWYQFDKPIDFRLEKIIIRSTSYMKKGAEFMMNPQWGLIKLYNPRKRAFPCGLLQSIIPILDSWKKQYGEDYVVESSSQLKRYPIQLTGARDYQKGAIEAFWANQGGVLNLSVASGKTMVGERILASCGPDINKLVLCPTKELVAQWKEELDGHINVAGTTKKECRVETLQKIYNELKKDRNCLNNYDIVVFDEVHRVAADTFYKIGMACGKAVILGLTGTPRRSDGADMKIRAVCGPIVYTAQIEELTEKGYLTPVKVNIINIPKVKLSADMDYHDIYEAGIVNNTDRNSQIVNIADIASDDGMVLVLFDRIEHGKRLYEEFKRGDRNIDVAFIHGTTKDRDIIFKEVQMRGYKIILASRIFNEGINLPELKTLIIASAGKSPVRIIQQIGRVLRLHSSKEVANVYDFRDSCKTLSRHFKERMKIYQENGFEVVEI